MGKDKIKKEIELENDKNKVMKIIRKNDFTSYKKAEMYIASKYPLLVKTFTKNRGLIKAYIQGNFYRHQKQKASMEN